MLKPKTHLNGFSKTVTLIEGSAFEIQLLLSDMGALNVREPWHQVSIPVLFFYECSSSLWYQGQLFGQAGVVLVLSIRRVELITLSGCVLA